MDKTRIREQPQKSGCHRKRANYGKDSTEQALYSRGVPQGYRIPLEPNPGDTGEDPLPYPAKDNVDAVYFISGSTRAQMQVGLVRNGFDYYEIEIRSEMSRSAIFLRFRQAAWSVITTSSVSQESCRRCTLSALSRASIRRTGRRALSCIRFLWTASATEIRPTMC